MDLVSLAMTAAFYVPFAVSVRRYLQRRDPLELAVVLVFSSIAALFAVSWLASVVPSLAPTLDAIGLLLLMAQPVLMVRLVGLFRPLPAGALEVATAGSVVSIVWYYATGRSEASVLILVGCFAVTELTAALALLADARRRQGFPRVRLSLAAGASVLFGLAVVVSSLGPSATPGTWASSSEAVFVSRLVELVAAIGYLVAFVPPRWIRDLAHRAIAFDLVRSIVSAPTGTDPAVLWSALLRTVSDVLGTTRVVIVDGEHVLASGSPAPVDDRGEPLDGGPDGGDGVLALGGDGALAEGGETLRWPDAGARGGVRIRVPLATEGRPVGELRAVLDGRPLFLDDDVALVALLGSLTARAVEREQAVASLTEAARAVSEADALRASEARFRALLDTEPNAIFIVGRDGVVRWATASAARMFGRAAEDLVGRCLDDLVSPVRSVHREAAGGADGGRATSGDGAPANDEAMASDSAPSDSALPSIPHRYEALGSLADGGSFPAEVAVTEMELDGEASRLAVITDITWRKEADALRDQFIGVLSHELRTPVTAIYGGSQLLLRGGRLDESTRTELIADVAAEAERLQRMIENLLVLARVERGADVADLAPVLAHRLIPAIVERERTMTPGLAISVAIPAYLPVVTGDEASITLVLRNLISNAAKYAGPDAHIEVRAEDDGSEGVLIRVLDDGPGISADEADALFGLYFRSNAAKAAPGSGIGLFVCRQLVEAMGGRISARPRPSGGAEFAFSLPRHPDGGSGVQRGTSASGAGDAGDGADRLGGPRVNLAAAR